MHRKHSQDGSESQENSSNGDLDLIMSEVSKGTEKRHWENWVQVSCPYCGENFEVHAESQEDGQTIYQDCQVCCKPISIFVQIDEDEELHVSVARS